MSKMDKATVAMVLDDILTDVENDAVHKIELKDTAEIQFADDGSEKKVTVRTVVIKTYRHL